MSKNKKENLEILNRIQNKTTFDETQMSSLIRRHNEFESDINNRENEFKKHRNSWNINIIIWIYILIVSQIVLLILVGCNCFKFNSNTLPLTFITETFLQIIGLAIIIVKFLFK